LPLETSSTSTLAAAAAAVTVGSTTLLYVLLKKKQAVERDASGGTGATFNSQLGSGLTMLQNSDSVLARSKVEASMNAYSELFEGKTGQSSTSGLKAGEVTSDDSVKKRQAGYQTMVTNFYDLVTDFYEYGWCQSFHFAPRAKGETFLESIKRAEYHLCSRLGMRPGVRVLDVGCGVGGPMRNMAIFSGATIEGVTINEYQVRVGNKYHAQAGLGEACHTTQGDFQSLPDEWQNSFDCAYAIEATCHSPDKTATFTQVAKCLKQGGLFAGYEWCVLPDDDESSGKKDEKTKERGYDATNDTHVAIKEGIEIGNGLPTLATPAEVKEALEAAGFSLVDAYDANAGAHSIHQVPWYDTLNGKMSLSGFRMTRLGRACTHAMVSTLELLRIAPRGTTHVSAMLNATAIDLVEGGKREIFTPSYFFLAKKN